MMHVRDRERLYVSFLLAVILHALIFLAVHFISPFIPEPRAPYLGPITVVLPDLPRPQQVQPPRAAETPEPPPAETLPARQTPQQETARPAQRTSASQTGRAASGPTTSGAASAATTSGAALSATTSGAASAASPRSRSPLEDILFPESIPMASSQAGAAENPPESNPVDQPRKALHGGVDTGSRVIYGDQAGTTAETRNGAVSASSVPGTGTMSVPGTGTMSVPGTAQRSGTSSSSTQLGSLDAALASRQGSSGGAGGTGGTGGTTGQGSGTRTAGQTQAESQTILTVEELKGKRAILYQPEILIPEGLSLEGKTVIELVVRLTIAPSGLILSAVLETQSGHTELDEAVTGTLRQWRFNPLPSNVTAENQVVRLRVQVRAR